MIDELVSDIPDARDGFRMTFSAAPFPDFQRELEWLRPEFDGHWYRSLDPEMEGWLCPALFKYFEEPPEKLYVRADALEGGLGLPVYDGRDAAAHGVGCELSRSVHLGERLSVIGNR